MKILKYIWFLIISIFTKKQKRFLPTISISEDFLDLYDEPKNASSKKTNEKTKLIKKGDFVTTVIGLDPETTRFAYGKVINNPIQKGEAINGSEDKQEPILCIDCWWEKNKEIFAHIDDTVLGYYPQI